MEQAGARRELAQVRAGAALVNRNQVVSLASSWTYPSVAPLPSTTWM